VGDKHEQKHEAMTSEERAERRERCVKEPEGGKISGEIVKK